MKNSTKDKSAAWSGKSYGGYWGTLSFLWLLKIGMWPAYFLLIFVAAFFMVFRRKAVAPIVDYLWRIYGEKVGAISWKTYKIIFSFGVCILDKTAYFSDLKNIKICDESFAQIKAASQNGKGVLILASHIGGWAIASGELAKTFADSSFVGAKKEREEIEKLVSRGRRREAPQMLAESDDSFSTVAVYEALKAGKITAMHADRDAGGRFVEIDFLGGKVVSPCAPYIAAWRAGAEVLQIFCVRESIFNYRIFCKKIDISHCFSPMQAAECGAKSFFANVAQTLKSYPHQWFNFYEYWR